MANLEPKFVVDTNVILKLFFQEEDTDMAALLFQRLEAGFIQIFIPDLLAVEFISILWVKLRQGQADRHHCQTILRMFLDLAGKMESLFRIAGPRLVGSQGAYLL